MNINEVFSGAYFKASDIKHKAPLKLTISNVKLDQIDGQNKLIVEFQNEQSALVCNKTNSTAIAEVYGEETDNWSGKRIALIVDRVAFQNSIVDAIRIKFPPQPGVAQTGGGQQPQQPQTGGDQGWSAMMPAQQSGNPDYVGYPPTGSQTSQAVYDAADHVANTDLEQDIPW